jgi:tRNA dimethylallyltransferase
VLLLLGPTASGKTHLALALAQRLQGEIISVDSALVYRGMDIGTAKPLASEQALVPHHLIDIMDPEDTGSAADFLEAVRGLLPAVRGRGRVPILVGGTVLYFRSLLQGIDAMPPVDPDIRSRLREEMQALGSVAMHERLAGVDAVAASRIHPNDPQRILRALEVFSQTGMPLSQFHSHSPPVLPDDWFPFILWPQDRAKLHRRIEERFDEMLALGFEAELDTLIARPRLTAAHPSQRSVGYRQGWMYRQGHLDRATFREKAITATRQLAKRQLTGLRAMTGMLHLPAESARVEDILTRLLAERR